MPAISLIIPLYNAEKYLRPCLDSAKNQTFEDIEIICINDGSTDNTADIVNEYVAEDSRFRLIEQENAGCSMARNHGLKSAMSPYVALLDQDDVLHPQAMEVLHHLITKYNADVAEFVNETVPDDFVIGLLSLRLSTFPASFTFCANANDFPMPLASQSQQYRSIAS